MLASRDSMLLDARVAHQRTFPRAHGFDYGVFYLAESFPLGGSRTTRSAFRNRDHGFRDATPLHLWAQSILARFGLHEQVKRVVLLAMPRTLGYVFNPVSFWFCLDNSGEIRAVLCEVNNTFGESHTYVVRGPAGRPIRSDDWIEADKVFHVSPFMDRRGYYRFRFSLRDEQLSIQINYFDEDDRLMLRTSLAGKWLPDTSFNRARLRFSHPLVTLKTIGLIHYHALRLALKKIGYRPKPPQREQVVTPSRGGVQPPLDESRGTQK